MKYIITLLLFLASPLTVFSQEALCLFQLTACQPDTLTPLPSTSVTINTPFDLVLQVQDLRPEGEFVNYRGLTKPLVRGVFAAYCDIHYNKNLATLTPILIPATPTKPAHYADCKFTPQYANGKYIDKSPPDHINDVGGFASAFTGDTELVEVGRMRFVAKSIGHLTFMPSTINIQKPQHDTLIYGNTAAQPPEGSAVTVAQTKFTDCFLDIEPTFIPAPIPVPTLLQPTLSQPAPRPVQRNGQRQRFRIFNRN